MRRAFLNLFSCYHHQIEEVSCSLLKPISAYHFSLFILFVNLISRNLRMMLEQRGYVPLILAGAMLRAFMNPLMPEKGVHIQISQIVRKGN